MTLTKISLNYLKTAQIPQVVELDNLYLGGLWSEDSYRKEIESPNSTLLALFFTDSPLPPFNNDPFNEGESRGDEESCVIIGYGCLWSILEEAHITMLLIDPDYQGQGLGQLLLYSLLEDAVKRGLERATLEVRANNQVALSLYEKFGFKIAGRRKNYYAQTREDALILWRSHLNDPEFQRSLEHWQEKINAKLAQHNWQFTVVKT